MTLQSIYEEIAKETKLTVREVEHRVGEIVQVAGLSFIETVIHFVIRDFKNNS